MTSWSEACAYCKGYPDQGGECSCPCARQSEHDFEKDDQGVERCVKCGTTWLDSVRGIGIGGDLPAHRAAMAERMNRT